MENTLVLMLIGYSSAHLPPWLEWEGRAATEGIDASIRGAWEQPAVEAELGTWAFLQSMDLDLMQRDCRIEMNNHEPLFNPWE